MVETAEEKKEKEEVEKNKRGKSEEESDTHGPTLNKHLGRDINMQFAFELLSP